jgi:uncharacterized circularly permuted ATP-grasp superfamily protein
MEAAFLFMTLENLLLQYNSMPGLWDEVHDGEAVRSFAKNFFATLHHLDIPSLEQKEKIASELFMNQGITFTVYSDDAGIERIFPFDVIPRIITTHEWRHIEKGIEQRLKALNLFFKDIYSEQQIIKDQIIPAELIASCPHYTREVFGIVRERSICWHRTKN